ncbi:serine hydrolase [Rhodocaloribacter litoris]|uniref:serine hydrolase domain-containing protein n=1 Tax=Rhodocaloribacter litoris TaxID=2558931 RepID=UPI001E2CFFD6|nr:serine hydrolase [Rhodocaloribacter litoris]QXD15708.1 serine hydrolase [Rhodocaloribacter litoris]
MLTVEHLHEDGIFSLMDMSYFARPEWSRSDTCRFSGSVSFQDTELTFPVEREYYVGENVFPGITLDFVSNEEELIPIQKEILVDGLLTNSSWNVIVGTGNVWHEREDGEWCRASFPLSLTDSYIGQVRNCVATFVHKQDAISNVYMQCSQETADLNDRQIGDIRVMLPAAYRSRAYADSLSVIEKQKRLRTGRLPVHHLSKIDVNNELAGYFGKLLYTSAPTSLGAVLMDGEIYLHPPETRHGRYPYPHEMRHAVYSVSKSMTGALALFYFGQRYGDEIFDALITDYVPALSDHPAWQGVTFLHTLNMVTGTEGGEEASHLYEVLVKARSAEEAIRNIASLGDYPGGPGESFNYASTNFFVLSYALQKYVEQKEGIGISYWGLVRKNVLLPLGAEDFTLLHTVEPDGSRGLPILAYGAWPTLDEAAKIALLFSNEGNYRGKQLLHRGRCREALGRTTWTGYSTGNDYRGKYYRHSFWTTKVAANRCDVQVTYMLGYGGNYVWFFADNVIVIRFMDEYDMDFENLIRGMSGIKSLCQ